MYESDAARERGMAISLINVVLEHAGLFSDTEIELASVCT